jgi:hypothetical protein
MAVILAAPGGIADRFAFPVQSALCTLPYIQHLIFKLSCDLP